MTPQERAEKIIDISVYRLVGNQVGDALIKIAAAQISEAERKAYAKGFTEAAGECTAYAEGFRAAKEKARGIAEECKAKSADDDCHYEIAQRIGDLSPFEPKGSGEMEP